MPDEGYLSVRQFGMKYPSNSTGYFDRGVEEHIRPYENEVFSKHKTYGAGGKITEIPLGENLHATQPDVDEGPVEWNAKTYAHTGSELGEDSPGSGPPIVLRSQGMTDYVINGHHRIAGAIKSGKSTGKVRLHDFGEGANG